MSWTFIVICAQAWCFANNYISNRNLKVCTAKDYIMMDCLAFVLTVLPIVITAMLLAKGVVTK